MTYGVIDTGSNTIRLCIYDFSQGKIVPLFNNKTTAGLIGHVKNGELTKKGIKKACDVLNSYKEIASETNIESLFVFATASLRNISNREEAVRIINEETGLQVDVLSGYEEATLDFRGAAHAMELDNGVMLDIGGGSTEILVYENGEIIDADSIQVGSLSLFREYVSQLFPTEAEKHKMENRVIAELQKVEFIKGKEFEFALGIGGTIRAVKNLNNDMFGLPRKNDQVSARKISLLLSELKANERSTLKQILDTAPDRIHTLMPGMVILNTICNALKCTEIKVSNYGVREGYLFKKVVLEKQ